MAVIVDITDSALVAAGPTFLPWMRTGTTATETMAMTFEQESPAGPEAAGAEAHRSARDFSLAEKLRIVHEANTPGVKFRYVERKYGLGKNVLAYWRRAYGGLTEAVLGETLRAGGQSPEVVALRLQVERLERLLGQKTLELELLRAGGQR